MASKPSQASVADLRRQDRLRNRGPILRRGDGRPAVAITPAMVDGGTRVELAARGLVGPMAATVSRLRAHGCAGEQVSLGRVGAGEVWGEVLTSGRTGGTVAILVADVVHVTIARTFVRLEFKAGGLWREGWAAVAGRWIEAAAGWVGVACSLATSHAAGWRVTGLELCRDFQGLGAWSREDADPSAWIGWRSATITTHAKIGRAGVSVSLGSRKGSPVSACCYGKTEQILACGGIGAAAMYGARWSQSQDYEPSREVARVEFRLRRRGLDLACARTGECNLLRDPAALGDGDLLARVWVHLAARYRLVVAAERERKSTHRTKIPSDPRWLVVASGPEASGREFVQSRAVQQAALADQQARSRRRMLAAVAGDAGLYGARPSSPRAALEWVAYRFAETHPAEFAAMGAKAEQVTRSRMAADGLALEHASDRARITLGCESKVGWSMPQARPPDRPRRAATRGLAAWTVTP